MVAEFLGICLALPMAVGLAISWAGRRWVLKKARPAWAFAIAYFIATVAASWILIGNQVFQPDRYWHWLPAFTVLALIGGAMCGWRACKGWGKSAWLSGLSVAFAWLLVPTWTSIEDQRILLIGSLAAIYFVATLVTLWLSEQHPTSNLGYAIIAAFFVGAAIIGIDVSLTYARLLLIGGSALVGCILSLGRGKDGSADHYVVALPAIFGWLVGGLFIGGVDPSPMRLELLGIALGPLFFGVATILISTKMRATNRVVLAWLAFALPIIGVLIVYWLRR